MRFTAEQHMRMCQLLLKKAESQSGAEREKTLYRANGFLLLLSRMAERIAKEVPLTPNNGE